METTLDIAALAKAVFWPVAVVVLLVHFRSAVVDLVKAVGSRVKSIKVGELSLEFAEAKELQRPGWTGGAVDLRHAGTPNDVTDSTQRAFYEQFRDLWSLDYAVVDLGHGLSWLTSRLFILAVIMRRMRGLAAFVFVETPVDADADRRYVGVADCQTVRWRLAARYPWLERNLAAALSSPDPTLGSARVVDDNGRLGYDQDPYTPDVAGALLRAFLAQAQGPIVPANEAGEWVALPDATPPTFEHSQWITRAMVKVLLGDALDPTHLTLERLEPLDDPERARAVIRHGGRFVAVTRDARIFHQLLNRWQLVEVAAKLNLQPPGG